MRIARSAPASIALVLLLAYAACSDEARRGSFPSPQGEVPLPIFLQAAEANSTRWAHTALDSIRRLPPVDTGTTILVSHDFPAAVPEWQPEPLGVDWQTPRPAVPRLKLRAYKQKIWTDYRHYYSWCNLRDLLLGVAAGSLLANTSLDQDFQDWYQADVRSPGTDDLASFWKTFGEGSIFIPAFAGLAVVGGVCDEIPLCKVTGQFGGRATRAYLVGAPPLLFMQLSLGGSRPGESQYESRWRPFQDDNGVSGHAFMGAVPFITAAKMTDRPLLKGGLYLFSTFPAWSRINDDRHYLSQICIGWWMAYLACDVVDRTDSEERRFTLTPVATSEMVGLGLICRR